MSAYRIIEETLNLKPIKVMDYIEDNEGKKRAVLNEKETLLAQEKQSVIKSKFAEWVYDDLERTEDLCHIYNEKFNSTRPREYDGSHITFGGINPEITLRKHQRDAIAHTLYGGNTLLAHSVGAGKTFEMVASAMESKRLGLCTKSMIVVPKHIVNQVASEFLQLYPTANILVPNEKDFSKDNRERFCSRIATGNYDAIIISHTQLEKIPLSMERQIEYVQTEINDIVENLENLKNQEGSRGFTVKQLEQTKKNLETKLDKLNNDSKRDSTVTFEELGVDKLYIDEAHQFKNKFFVTKMGRNVAGINASSASQRAEDLAMKCRYLDDITGSRGVVFATGTSVDTPQNAFIHRYYGNN
jgi:N12 class adenine-specific DNA methylase